MKSLKYLKELNKNSKEDGPLVSVFDSNFPGVREDLVRQGYVTLLSEPPSYRVLLTEKGYNAV